MHNTLTCELISWQKFSNLSHDLAMEIKRSAYQPDLIIAIGRGGYTPARVLSDLLNVNNLTSFKIEHYQSSHKSPQAIVKYPLTADINGLKILLVDDVSDTGDTYVAAIQHIESIGQPAEIRSVALHFKAGSHYEPYYYAEIVKEWRWIIYPWAVFEDVSEFINNMSPKPEGLVAIQEQLRDDHKLLVPTQILKDVLELMDA